MKPDRQGLLDWLRARMQAAQDDWDFERRKAIVKVAMPEPDGALHRAQVRIAQSEARRAYLRTLTDFNRLLLDGTLPSAEVMAQYYRAQRKAIGREPGKSGREKKA